MSNKCKKPSQHHSLAIFLNFFKKACQPNLSWRVLLIEQGQKVANRVTKVNFLAKEAQLIFVKSGIMDKNYRQIEQFIDGPTTINSKAYHTSDDVKSSDAPQEPPLTMEAFLADIEKRAYHMAAFATNSHADALDLLQDAMIKLVSNYGDHPSEQWKPLFYKILQNRIRDWHRHQKVKNLIFFWQSPQQNDDDDSPIFESQMSDEKGHTPESDIEKTQQQQAALQHLKQLSDKQQQCFLLRSWEGLSTEQTAEIMDCSQGSVKTHYSRAVTKLKTLMEADHDITF